MVQQFINIGSTPNDKAGDNLRVGGDKINDNFSELYEGKQDGSPNLSALGSEEPSGFWTNQGASVAKVPNRVFLGGAADIPGMKAPASSADKTWVGNAPGGYMTYFETRSQMPVFSTNGGIAAATASRSSDNDRPGELATIATAAFAFNDNANASDKKSAWAYYGHAAQTHPNKFTTSIELDTANLVSDVPIDPYSMEATGASATAWFGVGGEIAQGLRDQGDTTSQKAVSVGLGFVNTCGEAAGNRYLKGIVFQASAIAGTDGITGTGTAIEFARGHELVWKYSAGVNAIAGKIRGEHAAGANQTRLVFAANGLQVRGVQSDLTTETTLFRVASPTLSSGQQANNLFFGGQAWASGTGALIVGAEGAATDISISLRSKGAGSVGLGDATGASKIAAGSSGIAFFGGALSAKLTISGSRGGNVALADLLSKLATYGLITDGTSA